MLISQWPCLCSTHLGSQKGGRPDCGKALLKTGWTHEKGFHPPRQGRNVTANLLTTIDFARWKVTPRREALRISDPGEGLHRCTLKTRHEKASFNKPSGCCCKNAERFLLNTAAESNFTSRATFPPRHFLSFLNADVYLLTLHVI